MGSERSSTRGRELLISKVLDAPVELVWEVWTDPKHIAQWWGPDGFTNTIHVMDVKPGGEWNLVMHGPDGNDYLNRIIFLEIVTHKKLVFEYRSSPKHLTTVEFEAKGNRTALTWHMTFESQEQFIQLVKAFRVDESLHQNVTKLNDYLGVMQAE